MRHYPEHREIFPSDEGDDPGRDGRGGHPRITHECIDCHAFKGNGLLAWKHHREHHHRIQIVGTTKLAKFGCCTMEEPAEDLLIEGGADYFVGLPGKDE